MNARERYQNDPVFHALVDAMRSLLEPAKPIDVGDGPIPPVWPPLSRAGLYAAAECPIFWPRERPKPREM